MQKKQVLIVGAGFAGLCAAKQLAKSDNNITIIDKTNHHLFQPLLYQVASAVISPREIAIPVRDIFKKNKNITVYMGTVVHVHLDQHQIELGNGSRFSYDYLVLAVGARHSYFGKDGWEEFAPGLKTVQDAIRIREQILISFEKAERMAGHGKSQTEYQKYLNFVIVGGGPTGVEMAGAIAEIARHTLKKTFRNINPGNAKIYLIEGLPNVLNVYPLNLSLRAKKDLEDMGVEVFLNEMVTDISPEGVKTTNRFIASENVIWAAGNQASPLLKTLGLPLDKQGRALVEQDLSLPGHPNVFIVGDACNSWTIKEGKPLPGIAPTAIQEGTYVGKIIASHVPRAYREPFSYFDKGSMATIGHCRAVGIVGGFTFTGFFAWLAWCFIHILYLIGFRNRLAVLFEWLICFITGQRGARLIYRSIEKEISHKSTAE